MIAWGSGTSDGAPRAMVDRKSFGSMPDGSVVEAISLTCPPISVTIITLGAALQSVLLPDRDGKVADVLLGYDDLAGYIEKPNFFGATIGRVANRIAEGRYVLDGQSHSLPINDPPNTIHGGDRGFDKAVWRVVSVEEADFASVTLAHRSPDGDQGHAGKVDARATYRLSGAGELTILLHATTDQPTIVDMTNHAYWNLAGEGSPGGAMSMQFACPAAEFLPTDETSIPTGEFRRVDGTPFDFRTPTAIDQHLRDGNEAQLRLARGYDHYMVVDRDRQPTPRVVARLEDPSTGRILELLSDQPGLQFYTGNYLDGTIAGKGGHIYREGDSVSLEPQMFPNTANTPSFGSIRLGPSEEYRNTIVVRFSATRDRRDTGPVNDNSAGSRE